MVRAGGRGNLRTAFLTITGKLVWGIMPIPKKIAAAAKGATVKPGLAIHGSEVDNAMKMLKEWV